MHIDKPNPDRGGVHAVRTLDQTDFVDACTSLMRMVTTNYLPSVLIGIRTGGFVVAEAMARSVQPVPAVLPLTCRRPSTSTKARLPFLQRALAALPRDTVDSMRVIEHRLLSARRRRQAKVPDVNHDEAGSIAATLADTAEPHRLLVVDDAVDSGVTLATVLDLLRASCPAGTELKSAVITTTLDAPRVMPDFSLYSGVLCRFPWSFDAAR